MDVPSDWTSPACGDSRDEVAYLTPCLHQLCYGCALRWAKTNPRCAFCRETINTIKYSVRSDDDYLECAVPEPTEHLAEDQQDQQEAVEPVPRAPDLSFPPEVWAAFFREHTENIEPLHPWLRQEVETVSGSEWWEVAEGLSTVISFLPVPLWAQRGGLGAGTAALPQKPDPALEPWCGSSLALWSCAAQGSTSSMTARTPMLQGARSTALRPPTATPPLQGELVPLPPHKKRRHRRSQGRLQQVPLPRAGTACLGCTSMH